MYNSTSTDWTTRYFQTKLTPASTGMPFDTWKNWMSKKDVQKRFDLEFVNPQRTSNFQMLKPIAGLAFQQGASIIGDYAR